MYPLIPIRRNRNSNIDDLAINIDTIIFNGEFSQLALGNAPMQLGLNTLLDMYSYRDPLFEIRQIGMSMVYSVF